MQAQETLRKYFGHEAFRPGQEVMVNALTHHRDALGVMPTGAGKSMCYQVPALMMPGVAIVISPLISLMADQVAALKSAGVPAAYLNSSLTPRQMELAMQRARQGAYKIIYVAPERLETPSFQSMAQSMPISLLAVDEAHCVSQWGQDFRPVYLRIADFVDSLPTRPVMGAFTATATERVRQDIIRLLRLQNPETVTTGFDRPNLYFEVIRPKNRDAALMDILRRKRGESGIVYCATRKAVEQVCDNLIRAGIDATRYHAGLSDEERKENQEKFQYDTCPVMVATNAFGMGIDKSNVRFVIHYQMPRSMEAYYQEAGRAGRDGEAAECILLYNGSDIFTAKWMIEHTEPNENMTAAEQSAVRYQDMNRLNRMVDYCTKPGCLRAFILRYFGGEYRAGLRALQRLLRRALRRGGGNRPAAAARSGRRTSGAAGDVGEGRQHRENRSPDGRRFVRAAAAGADGALEALSRCAVHHLQRRNPNVHGAAQAGNARRNAERQRHGRNQDRALRRSLPSGNSPVCGAGAEDESEREAAGRAGAVRRVPQPGAHRPQADAAQARLHAPARAGHPGHRLGQPERPGGTV